jgi:chaperone modulatory protein CbpM
MESGIMTMITQMHISFIELRQCISFSEAQLLELIAEGIITPLAGDIAEEWLFDTACVTTLHKAARLHDDLNVEWADIPLVLSLLEDVERLKAENTYLRQRLTRFEQDN